MAVDRCKKFLACSPSSKTAVGTQNKTNKADQPNRPSIYRHFFFPGVILALLVVTVSFSAGENSQKLVQGIVLTNNEVPLSGAVVKLFDSRGVEIASTNTDEKGAFLIRTDARQGEYELIVTRSQQLDEERVTLGRTNVQIRVFVRSAPYHAPRPAGSTVSARQIGTPEKARAHVLVAQERFGKMDLPGAVQELNAAIHIDATCSEAWSMRALVKLALRDFRSAIGDATEAIQLDPENASAYVALGTAHNSMKEFSAAEQALRQALEIEPEFWQAQLELAKTWYGEKRFVLSLRQLDLISQDFADVHLVRANALMSLNRPEEGIQEFRRFLQQAPNDPRIPQVQQILAQAGETILR
jgi:tetratricopeptide (TPR) repeat protein